MLGCSVPEPENLSSVPGTYEREGHTCVTATFDLSSRIQILDPSVHCRQDSPGTHLCELPSLEEEESQPLKSN